MAMNHSALRACCCTPPSVSASGSANLEPAELHHLGRRSYEETWRIQRAWLEERLADRRPDALLFVEHDPVFTVGRRGQEEHWRRHWPQIEVAGIPLHHVDRGGSVTYHGPGQLVVYPILRLTDHVSGVRAYVECLEEAVIQCLREWKAVIETYRVDACTAVATSAVRDAGNRDEFIGRVKRDCHLVSTPHSCTLRVRSAIGLSSFSPE